MASLYSCFLSLRSLHDTSLVTGSSQLFLFLKGSYKKLGKWRGFFLKVLNLILNYTCIYYFAESVCPTRIPVAARDEKGFDILVGLGVKKKVKKRIQIPTTNAKAYEVTSRVDLSELTRYLNL